MNIEKKIVIVGFGEMGKRHGLEFMEATMGLIKIAGVVEPDDLKYKQGCEWVKEPSLPRFETISVMLEKCRPDGIIISTPNHLHLENLRSLEGYDIPILLEKPLSTMLAEVEEVVRFAESYNGVIVVDHVMRYAPIIRRARQLINDGKLGKICSFQFTQHGDCGALFHTFRRSKTTGGGQMIEKATHDLDVMLFLTGSRPERVTMIAKQQMFGGNRKDDLHCSNCPDRLMCPSVSCHVADSVQRGLKDIDISNDLCAYSKAVDAADNEICLIELENGVFGTYSQNNFSIMPGHSRIYEVIGTCGVIYIELAPSPNYNGKLTYFPRNQEGEIEVFDFNYFGKIHYNGGPYVARHFYNIMCGTEKVPFTSVSQAFIAETLGFAAMQASDTRAFVNVESVVSDDLKDIYRSSYE